MFSVIKQWVIKTMMKGQTGVVRTLPKKELIELNTQITAERFMRNGINPEDMKTVGQVENVINQIDTPKVNVNPGMTSVKKADVLDMEGNKIPEGSGIMGGKANESDEAIKARLDADNKKGIASIKNNRMLDEDEIAELDMDIGGLEYTNDFDGTVGSANKLRKERADYIAEMELEYKKGNLDPEPGEANRERFLQQKFDEMEASGDNRLMTRDEVEELSSFDLQRDMDKSVEKFKKKDAKQKKTLKDFDPKDRDPSADGGRIGLKGGMGKAFIEFLKNAGKTMNDKSPAKVYTDYLRSVKDRAQKGDMKTLAPELGIIAGGGILTNRFLKKKLEKMTEDVKAEVEKKADGGRIGFFKGAQADTKKGKAMSPGTTASGGFRGGNNNDDGPKGPPSIINPPPKDNKPPETITFDDVTGKKMTAADRLAKQKFIDFINSKKVYNSGENEEVDDLYNSYRTVRGLDINNPKTINATTDSFMKSINGDTQYDYNITNDTIKDLITGNSRKSLTVENMGNTLEDRIVRPSGVKSFDIPQPFGAPQSLSVDPYKTNTGVMQMADLNSLGLTQMRNLEKKKGMEPLGGDPFTDKDQQMLDELERRDADPDNTYGPVFAANGGRIGLKGGMTKRAFMKLMGGVGASIGAAKSGIFSGFGKGAGKTVAKEVAQQTTSGMPPPYFFKLAEKIKNMGTDVTSTSERTITKSLKSKNGKSEYILEEDMATGDTLIKKVNKEGDDMITDVEIMELRKGEDVVTKDGKAIKTQDQYEEVTETNSRINKDNYNASSYEDGMAEESLKDIIEEASEQAPSIKYASGGLAYMLGE